MAAKLRKKPIGQKQQTVKKCQFLFHSHGGATYTQKQHIHGATMQLNSPHALISKLY